MKVFPGRSIFHTLQINAVHVDASKQGSDYVNQNDMTYQDRHNDIPEIESVHINYNESISAVLSARRWVSFWLNSVVLYCTDNVTATSSIIKGETKSLEIMPWVS